MNWQLSVPAKTFLGGEYAVLQGAPALLLTTAPRFELYVKKKQSNIAIGHAPAAKLQQQYPAFFSQYQFEFIDPYLGLGGLGASSAEFAMLAAFKNYQEKMPLNIINLIAEYRQLSNSGKGFTASGADVAAQLTGGISYYQANSPLSHLDWPFANLSYVLLHTGNKIATHAHLAELQPELNTIKLVKATAQLWQALETNNAVLFCDAINHSAILFQDLGLVIDHTQQLLKLVQQRPQVLAAKGCGALGADIILVLLEPAQIAEFLNWAAPQFKIIASGQQTEAGLIIKEEATIAEQVILVDKNDRQIGLAEKLLAHQQALLHRAYSVFIFRHGNNGIETLLQQRALTKYHGGGLWSNACCSHPHLGETIMQSATTRLQQEMGLVTPLVEIGAFTYQADMQNKLFEHEYDHVLVGRYDDVIQPDKNEVHAYEWVELKQLQQQLINEPRRFTPWLQQALELVMASSFEF